MLDAALWGLIQGLTEFLPISSSGHLVLIPALLGRDGPDLATSAVLHLGTLVAVVVYFRTDIAEIARATKKGRRLLTLLVIGTIPAAAIGLLFKDTITEFNTSPRSVAIALTITGVVLLATQWIPRRDRSMTESTPGDAAILGLGQALALIPGVSRSGSTIATGLLRGFDRTEAARYSFLLGVPAIAGAGLLQFIDLAQGGGQITAAMWLGVAVAAISGYATIALLLKVINRLGLAPFGTYCITFGLVALVLL